MTKSALACTERSRSGFTLIELMVVITIIGTLVVVLLPQLAHFNNDQMLKNAAADLKSNIRKTQNNASSGLNCNEAGLAASKWTMSFTKNAGNYTIAATCSNGNPGTSKTVSFPSGITISKINDQSCSAAAVFNNISSAISFTTPNNDNECALSPNAPMIITLEDSKAKTTTLVTIERGGAVY